MSGQLFADYSDGETALSHRVALHLMPADRPTTLRLTLADGSARLWPLEALRRLPDQAVRGEMVLTLAHEPLARLRVVGRGPIAEIEALVPTLDKRPPVARRGRLFGWSLAALASVALIIFGLVPTMANRLATFLPPAGEKALGDATFEQIRAVLGQESDSEKVWICYDADGRAALEKMRVRLNADKDLPYPVALHVLDHDLVNAFALPGGHVVLFRGLLEAAETPEEVAAVLAHELGHVARRDPARGALRSAGSIGVLGLVFGDFAGGTAMLFLANQLINANYSQAAEAGADDYAHALLHEAGLSPAALGSFFARLRARYGDEEGLAAHFASHPQLLKRIEAATAAAEGVVLSDPVLTDAEWSALRGICAQHAEADEATQPAPHEDRRETKGKTGDLSPRH